MQKQLAFVITAAVLLATIASVALYTVHIANAQSNMTSAKNMTKGSNMTGATGNSTSSSVHTSKPAGCAGCPRLPPDID